MRFGIQYAFHPTPEGFRNAGDVILNSLGITGVSVILANHTTAGLILTGTGFLFKIISNLFTS